VGQICITPIFEKRAIVFIFSELAGGCGEWYHSLMGYFGGWFLFFGGIYLSPF